MKRRDFIVLLGSAAWPFTAHAQQADRIGHLAVLMGLAEDDPESKVRIAKLRRELERLGWLEGGRPQEPGP